MTEVVNKLPVTEVAKVAEVVIEAKPQPGEKTDPALLLQSLHDEREKRRLAEAEVLRLKTQPEATGEVFSDEGKAILAKVQAVEAKLLSKEKTESYNSITTLYPVLNDKSAEFEQFQLDNPGMKLDTAAKAFLIENDLYENPKPRKGLESASGGGRTPVQSDGSMTANEADELRVNNYNEYVRRIKAGTLKVR